MKHGKGGGGGEKNKNPKISKELAALINSSQFLKDLKYSFPS